MDLVQELNLQDFTEEEKNQVLAQFTDSLLKRLILRVYDKFSADEQQEFDRLAKSGDNEKVNKFLTDKIPDLDEIRNEEMRDLAEEMKSFLAATKTE